MKRLTVLHDTCLTFAKRHILWGKRRHLPNSFRR